MRSNELRATSYHKAMVPVKVEVLIYSTRLEFELLESSSRYGYLCSKLPGERYMRTFMFLKEFF